MTDQPFHFDGFAAPTTTPVPDEFFDRVLSHITGSECKVLCYIFRRTYGFKKSVDQISLSQMINGITTRDGRILDEGVGESRNTIRRALDGLVAKGIVAKQKVVSEERGFEANMYGLVFKK